MSNNKREYDRQDVGKKPVERITLRREIANAINRTCAENGSHTPDFILANYLIECLAAFDKATDRRDYWYRRNPPKGEER